MYDERQAETVLDETTQEMLNVYIDRLEQVFPGKIGGAYLHGSAAMNGFNAGDSDIDMVVLLNVVLNENELDELDNLHGEIAREAPALNLEVHYLQWSDLGRDKKEIPAHPFFQYGNLSRAARGHFNPNVWWILKHYGVTLVGLRAQDLPYSIEWQTVRAWNKGFLKNYWSGWTRKPSNLLSLREDHVINWAILGICRLYYNLAQREVTTKEEAGRFALDLLPQKHQRIVREALRIRAGEAEGLYRSNIQRAYEAARLIDYIVRLCQENARED